MEASIVEGPIVEAPIGVASIAGGSIAEAFIGVASIAEGSTAEATPGRYADIRLTRPAIE